MNGNRGNGVGSGGGGDPYSSYGGQYRGGQQGGQYQNHQGGFQEHGSAPGANYNYQDPAYQSKQHHNYPEPHQYHQQRHQQQQYNPQLEGPPGGGGDSYRPNNFARQHPNDHQRMQGGDPYAAPSPRGYGGPPGFSGPPGPSAPKVPIDTIIEMIRQKCLQRGAAGIKGLGRMFRLYDRDRSRTLSHSEFAIGLSRYGVDLKPDELKTLFQHFDSDNNGVINFDELLEEIRPPLSRSRIDILKRAFNKMDVTGDGVIKVDDLMKSYKVSENPKFKAGVMTKGQCFKEFLDNFQQNSDKKDDEVTFEEFTDYYRGVSNSIDKDVYFDYMIRQSWNL